MTPKHVASREKKNSGWISVKDRLPDEEGFYLCYVPSTAPSRKILFFNDNNRFEHILDDEITHWSELLKPPPQRR